MYIKEIDNGGVKIPYEYIARCECENGEKYSYEGSKINDAEHRSKYYVPITSEIGIV